MTDNFPLSGIIGVIANHPDEIDLARQKQLGCVELRADLLLDNGMAEQELMALIKRSKTFGLGCLFTLRHPSHGGKFTGSEQQRVMLGQQAVAAGADMIDLEWDTQAGQTVADQQLLPLILSYHNFNGMLSAEELADVTRTMERMNPAAIKIVPTAAAVADAATMLQWVAGVGSSESIQGRKIQRIGFAMGGCAAVSRILTTASGGAVTYAAFGEVVAPGQIDIDELRLCYRAAELNERTQVTAVISADDLSAEPSKDTDQQKQSRKKLSLEVNKLNEQWAKQCCNQIAVGFPGESASNLEPIGEVLGIKDYLTV